MTMKSFLIKCFVDDEYIGEIVEVDNGFAHKFFGFGDKLSQRYPTRRAAEKALFKHFCALLLTLTLIISVSPALAGEPFNWDRYHDRRDACTEADRIAAACTRGYCDELALRQAKRACSPYHERRD
jgi:hypothetical protein